MAKNLTLFTRATVEIDPNGIECEFEKLAIFQPFSPIFIWIKSRGKLNLWRQH